MYGICPCCPVCPFNPQMGHAYGSVPCWPLCPDEGAYAACTRLCAPVSCAGPCALVYPPWSLVPRYGGLWALCTGVGLMPVSTALYFDVCLRNLVWGCRGFGCLDEGVPRPPQRACGAGAAASGSVGRARGRRRLWGALRGLWADWSAVNAARPRGSRLRALRVRGGFLRFLAAPATQPGAFCLVRCFFQGLIHGVTWGDAGNGKVTVV